MLFSWVCFYKGLRIVVLMELLVKKLYKTVVGSGSLRKLRREAMKTRINPAFDNNKINVEVVREKGRSVWRRAALRIKYEDPVEITEAYRHGIGYEALSSDLGFKMEWGSPYVSMDVGDDSVFSDMWELRDRRDSDHSEVGGNPLLWFLVRGDPSRYEELRDSDYVMFNNGDSDVKLRYEGKPVVGNSILHIKKEVTGISDDEVVVGKRFVKGWLKPFLTVERHLPEGVEGIVRVGDSYIYEENPTSVERISVEVPVSLGDGKDVIATYSFKQSD